MDDNEEFMLKRWQAIKLDDSRVGLSLTMNEFKQSASTIYFTNISMKERFQVLNDYQWIVLSTGKSCYTTDSALIYCCHKIIKKPVLIWYKKFDLASGGGESCSFCLVEQILVENTGDFVKYSFTHNNGIVDNIKFTPFYYTDYWYYYDEPTTRTKHEEFDCIIEYIPEILKMTEGLFIRVDTCTFQAIHNSWEWEEYSSTDWGESNETQRKELDKEQTKLSEREEKQKQYAEAEEDPYQSLISLFEQSIVPIFVFGHNKIKSARKQI